MSEISYDHGGGKLRHKVEAKMGEVKSLRALAGERKRTDWRLLTEAELVPEIMFVGEILHGDGFENMRFGMACSWQLIWDDSWILLEVKTSVVVFIH
tara:strand:- start:1275 stop:1565 length:291 start_codon:yes stop_codon:yes gene_type:complete